MDKWIPDELMQNIAKENLFSESAFTVKEGNIYHLRWFTPRGEIDFCGHATLGTGFVLFNYYEKNTDIIKFQTQVGELAIERKYDIFMMHFPAYKSKKIPVSSAMKDAIGMDVLEAYIARDLMLVLPNEEDVRNLKPDLQKVKSLDGLALAVTAKGQNYDCVSRIFAPKLNIDEDPVTGSAHCMITPYWCGKLGKKNLKCYQASERGGELYSSIEGDKVVIAGKAVLFSKGDIL